MLDRRTTLLLVVAVSLLLAGGLAAAFWPIAILDLLEQWTGHLLDRIGVIFFLSLSGYLTVGCAILIGFMLVVIRSNHRLERRAAFDHAITRATKPR